MTAAGVGASIVAGVFRSLILALWCFGFAADGFRAGTGQHSIEDVATDSDFGLLCANNRARNLCPMIDL